MAIATTLAKPCESEPRRSCRRARAARTAVGEHVLAVHAEPEAGDRDAELRGRDVAILALRILEHRLDEHARAGCPARPARRWPPGARRRWRTPRPRRSRSGGSSAAMMRKAVTRRPPCCRPAVPTMTDAIVPGLDDLDLDVEPVDRRPALPVPARGRALRRCAPRRSRGRRASRRRPERPDPAAWRPGARHAAVGQADRAQLRRLEFVRDAAEQLGDDVLERDQSRRSARRRLRRAPGGCGARAGKRAGDRPASCRARERSAAAARRSMRAGARPM